jgi:DNA-binding CsgD family transcriptional regulator
MSQMPLSERIVYILRENGLKKIDFARVLGVSGNYISLLASGKKPVISVPLARLIETTYGYRAEWVMTGEEPMRPENPLRRLQDNAVESIKSMDAGELRAVTAYIRTLGEVREESAVPPAVLETAFKCRLSTLTEGERRVFDVFSLGRSARQTAEELNLSLNTVKAHLKKIYKKLGVKSRRDLFEMKGGENT